MDRGESFQRYENNHKQQQPDAQAEDVGSERTEMLLQLLKDFHSASKNRKLKTR